VPSYTTIFIMLSELPSLMLTIFATRVTCAQFPSWCVWSKAVSVYAMLLHVAASMNDMYSLKLRAASINKTCLETCSYGDANIHCMPLGSLNRRSLHERILAKSFEENPTGDCQCSRNQELRALHVLVLCGGQAYHLGRVDVLLVSSMLVAGLYTQLLL